MTKEKILELSLLEKIMIGTSTTLGDDFFRALVFQLAQSLDVKYAFVAEFTEINTRVCTLAMWAEKEFIDHYEYDLSGTPCEDVVKGKLCHYPENIQALFPKDITLVEIQAQSYLGVPLIAADGEVLGHLAVTDIKPMPAEPRNLSIFQIFAARARAELERKRTEKALQESEERLNRVVNSAMDAIITINREHQISIFNEAAEKIFHISADKVIGKKLDPFLSESFREVLNHHINSFTSNSKTTSCVWIPQGLSALRSDKEEFPIEATLSHTKLNKNDLYTIILRDINDRKQAERELEKLHLENLYLQEEIKTEYNFEEIIGASKSIKKIFQQIEQVANTDANVLIIGETGAGKELIARAIHNRSKRKDRPLIKVNCAALSPGLIESEFFGHEKGAFTGAITQRIGRFELANGGTIFLDEIGDISLEVQAKLLRVLQEQEFERVGGSKTLRVDVRVITATNRDLKKAASEDKFRPDLYYRLNVFPIYLPPLRERIEDMPLLIRYFINKHMHRIGKRINHVTPELIKHFSFYTWPGNIRELENAVERAVILSKGDTLELVDDLISQTNLLTPTSSSSKALNQFQTLEEVERNYITKVLEQTKWVIEGQNGAAKTLGLNPSTLRSRMQKLGLHRPNFN
ncbi:MAG: sigma 54-interacting transcriptional regulator [Acidobacteria bacterium]|nr:sigma 54-interacting transcriptional regulator [Acidobacteriota bacterium]